MILTKIKIVRLKNKQYQIANYTQIYFKKQQLAF